MVFLHGLLGGVFYTWRQHDKVKERSWSSEDLVSEEKYSYCWPKDWIHEDGLDDRVRVIGVDCKYLSNIVQLGKWVRFLDVFSKKKEVDRTT